MNYFQKNLKYLRTKNNLSQEQFARLFGMTKSNINSYENGAFPKIENFIIMMEYFNLDPAKFIRLDMEKHSVSAGAKANNESLEAADRSKRLDSYVENYLTVEQQFQFLDNLSADELKKLYIKEVESRETILKENLELKAKYIALLEKKG